MKIPDSSLPGKVEFGEKKTDPEKDKENQKEGGSSFYQGENSLSEENENPLVEEKIQEKAEEESKKKAKEEETVFSTFREDLAQIKPSQKPEKRKSMGFTYGLSYLAVVLSVIALSLSVITFSRLQRNPGVLDQVVSEQDVVSSKLESIQNRVKGLEARTGKGELVGLTADLHRMLTILDALSDTSPTGVQAEAATSEIRGLLLMLEEKRNQPEPES